MSFWEKSQWHASRILCIWESKRSIKPWLKRRSRSAALLRCHTSAGELRCLRWWQGVHRQRISECTASPGGIWTSVLGACHARLQVSTFGISSPSYLLHSGFLIVYHTKKKEESSCLPNSIEFSRQMRYYILATRSSYSPERVCVFTLVKTQARISHTLLGNEELCVAAMGLCVFRA